MKDTSSNVTDMRISDSDVQTAYSQGLAHLEDKTRKLLGVNFKSARELWAMQVDLIRYQIQLHDRMREAKESITRSRQHVAQLAETRTEGWLGSVATAQRQLAQSQTEIRAVRHLLCFSRRLGDALAWLCFRLNQQHILPLSRNCPNSLPSRENLAGLLALAESFGAAGLGFPVIHDMTNVLRVGDITFVSGKGTPITIEVKGKIVRRDGDVITSKMTVHTFMDNEQRIRYDALHGAFQREEESSKKPHATQHTPLGKARARRQSDRMKDVHKMQVAKAGTIASISGQQTVTAVMSESGDSHNWSILREVIEGAQASGHAHAIADNAIIYIAVYRPTPLWYPWQTTVDTGWAKPILDAIDWKSVLSSGDGMDALCVSLSSQHFDELPPIRAIPLLLHPFPVETIIDFMNGRLLVLCLINPGRIVGALRDDGFEAGYAERERPGSPESLFAARSITFRNGQTGRMVLSGIGYHLERMSHECLSLNGFRAIARTMADEGERYLRSKYGEEVST